MIFYKDDPNPTIWTKGLLFETEDVIEYGKHGDPKLRKKSLYPKHATIRKYNLKAQGRDWKIW